MPRKSNRRDFLRGKAAGDALTDAVDRALPEAESPSEPEAYLVHVARSAMACQFEVFMNAGQYRSDMVAALEALDLVESLESQMTYFRPTSELSRINELAADEAVEVEPQLFELLELAMRLHHDTAGAFDITASPLWEVWGFARRAGRVPDPSEIDEARKCVGSHLVQLDPERRTVRFRRRGVRLNLGSIGKGYALDRAAAVMAASGIGDFLLHGGQSSILARGSRLALGTSLAEIPPGWSVGVRHPLRPAERLAEIRLCNQSLATSNSGIQFFRHQGRRYGHILDPRTGWPADKLLSVTVVAPTAALADGLSTAFFVMGDAAVLDYCGQHPEIGSLWMVSGPHGASMELKSAGLGPGQWRLLQPR